MDFLKYNNYHNIDTADEWIFKKNFVFVLSVDQKTKLMLSSIYSC